MWYFLGTILLIVIFLIGRFFRPDSFTTQVGKITNLHSFNQENSTSNVPPEKLYLINIYVNTIGDVRLNNETLYTYASIYDTVITEFKVRHKFFKKEFQLQTVIFLTGEIFPIDPQSLIALPK